jgi:hypothetical protein
VAEIVYLVENGDGYRLEEVTSDLDLHLDRIAVLAGDVSVTAYGETTFPSLMALPESGGPPIAASEDTSTLATPGIAPPTTAPAAGSVVPPMTTAERAPVTAQPPAGVGGSEKSVESAPSVVLQVPPPENAGLIATVSSQATNNSARLRAAFLKAPPETREALLKAIAVSETGYERVLQSLGAN